jgi:hypothetical protein
VKQAQIKECVRIYRKAVDAYDAVLLKIKAAHRAMEGLPLRGARRPLEEAIDDLERLGEGISVVPELVEDLRVEKRLSAFLREQAARSGLALRDDREVAEEEDWNDDETRND